MNSRFCSEVYCPLNPYLCSSGSTQLQLPLAHYVHLDTSLHFKVERFFSTFLLALKKTCLESLSPQPTYPYTFHMLRLIRPQVSWHEPDLLTFVSCLLAFGAAPSRDSYFRSGGSSRPVPFCTQSSVTSGTILIPGIKCPLSRHFSLHC